MGSLKVKYDYGFNTSGTGQHEVIEYVYTQPSGNPELEEGPYVVLYTEKKSTAECIAALLNVDGTDNSFPLTPMAREQGKVTGGVPWRPWELPHYRSVPEDAIDCTQSDPYPNKDQPWPISGRRADPHEYGMTGPGDCPPGDLGNEVR
jgi:hypothetical protein